MRKHKEHGGYIKHKTCLRCGYVVYGGGMDDITLHVEKRHGNEALQEWRSFNWDDWDPSTFNPPETLQTEVSNYEEKVACEICGKVVQAWDLTLHKLSHRKQKTKTEKKTNREQRPVKNPKFNCSQCSYKARYIQMSNVSVTFSMLHSALVLQSMIIIL